MIRSRALACFLAVLSLAGIACERDMPSGGNVPGSQAPSAAPSIVEGQPCPPPPEGFEPARSGCVSSTTGAFEKGQEAQTFYVYARVDGGGLPQSWHMRVTRETQPFLEAPLKSGSPASYPIVIGAEDADGKGLDEVFVKLVTHSYHSGKTQEVGMFGVQRGQLFRVEADGEPLLFQVGGVSVFGQGAECRDVDVDGDLDFLVLGIDGVVGYDQTWVERIYSWKDRALVLSKRREGRFAKTGYNDPLLWRFYSLRCRSFDPGQPYSRG